MKTCFKCNERKPLLRSIMPFETEDYNASRASNAEIPRCQAHHDDYSKPLEVRWLCVTCHAAHHVSVRRQERLSQVAA